MRERKTSSKYSHESENLNNFAYGIEGPSQNHFPFSIRVSKI
jgi:hypothetical protein